MTETTPAGWYPAPHANGEPRYWDGAAWHAAPPYVPAGPASPPPYATGPARPQGLAVTALILGVAAVLSALIPFLGLVVAIAGLVFGVIALVKRQPKGLAVTGTALSGLSAAWSLIVAIGLLSWILTPSSGSPEGIEPLPEESQSAEAPPLAPDAGVGSIEDPLPQPYVSESSYSVEARMFDDDATAEIASWSRYNDEPGPGNRYVLVEMTVTGLDPAGTEAYFAAYELSLATPDGSTYASAYVAAEDAAVMLTDADTLAEGESVTGLVAYAVPAQAEDFLLADWRSYTEF